MTTKRYAIVICAWGHRSLSVVPAAFWIPFFDFTNKRTLMRKWKQQFGHIISERRGSETTPSEKSVWDLLCCSYLVVQKDDQIILPWCYREGGCELILKTIVHNPLTWTTQEDGTVLATHDFEVHNVDHCIIT